MKEVTLRISNIQSHENTMLTLKPGLNFILANDNNVGKSTIFKILTTVAKAPHVTPAKLQSLMRKGCNQAYVEFTYEQERVLAWFQRDKGIAPKLFFEHTASDGTMMRMTRVPSSLLEALGIVVDDNGTVINFNEADSVQLISEISTEADAILTSVILDPRIEHIKSNIHEFARELDKDIRLTQVKEKDAQDTLTRLQYNDGVSDFFAEKEDLYALVRMCDDMPRFTTSHQPVFTNEEAGAISAAISLLSSLDTVKFNTFVNTTLDISDLEATASLVNKLRHLNLDVLQSAILSHEELDFFGLLIRTIQSLRQAVTSGWKVYDAGILVERDLRELAFVQEELKSQAEIVECPVRGEVFYTDEKCVPLGD